MGRRLENPEPFNNAVLAFLAEKGLTANRPARRCSQ